MENLFPSHVIPFLHSRKWEWNEEQIKNAFCADLRKIPEKMVVTLMEFGNHARKGVIFTMKSLYETVVYHPFFVCVVFALIYISRKFPFLFSLMLSASPVVICTAILLGTLLYYGQQNIHESEIEMKTKFEAISLRNRVPLDASVLDKSDRHFLERFGDSKRDDVDSSLFSKKLDEIRVDGGSLDGSSKGRRSFGGVSSLDGSSKGRRSFGVESESENGENWVENSVHQEKGGWSEERERERIGEGEVMADHYAIISKVIGELLDSESDHDKSDTDSCGSERGNRDEKNGDESGSDRGESSSPHEDEDDDDGSIDEIMPMLDELHPLLDEEGPQPPQISRAESEAALTEPDIQESEALDEDDEDDDDDDEDEKEDHSKSIITWTEEDQKNLMEVGNSEIERNQRLERILRRRKNRSMVPEINLMDFENSDFQFHIPPISTTRQNPFDSPHDSAPGSAPSYLQRRNPFDLPFDEDDPDEIVEESRENLKASLTRQPFLRRRDNFHAGPSIFSPIRQEKQPDQKLRPFFMVEQAAVDESSYSPFHRQSSGQSSVIETESVNSVEYLDDDDDDEKLEEADDQDQDQASNHQDQASNDEETADVNALSTLNDDVSSKGPVYDTDTSPSRHNRTQSEAPSMSSQFDDRTEAEHSADDEAQVQETSSTEENAARDSGEGEKSTP